MVSPPGGWVLKPSDGNDPPTFFLPMEAAQILLDDLYLAGLRPKEAIATDATIVALEAHIATLRQVVDALLQVVVRSANGA